MPTAETITARHEATHAVAAWLLGYRTRLTIDPADPDLAGNAASGSCVILTRRCPTADRLLVALAPLATGADLAACASDLIVAGQLAPKVYPGVPAIVLRDYTERARVLLGMPRVKMIVDTLAAELLDRQTLDADAVDAAILAGASQVSSKKTLDRSTGFLARLRAFWR